MTQFNPLAPLAPLANTARTVTEQLNVTNKALSDSVALTTGQLLTSLTQGIPGLGGNGGGNPNGQAGLGLPGLQTLFPAGALQAVTSLEEVVIPAGIPRPSALLAGVTGAPAARPAAVVTTEAAPERETQPTPQARPRVTQRAGY